MKIEQYVSKSPILAIGFAYDEVWRDLNARLRIERSSLLQALVLIALFFEKSQDASPRQMASSLGVTPSNLSHTLSAIEKRGFVRRSLDAKDARSYRIAITAEGKRAALRFIKLIDGMETHFEKRIGKDAILSFVRTAQELRSLSKRGGGAGRKIASSQQARQHTRQ